MHAIRWLRDRRAGDTRGRLLAVGPVVSLPNLAWLGGLRTRVVRCGGSVVPARLQVALEARVAGARRVRWRGSKHPVPA